MVIGKGTMLEETQSRTQTSQSRWILTSNGKTLELQKNGDFEHDEKTVSARIPCVCGKRKSSVAKKICTSVRTRMLCQSFNSWNSEIKACEDPITAAVQIKSCTERQKHTGKWQCSKEVRTHLIEMDRSNADKRDRDHVYRAAPPSRRSIEQVVQHTKGTKPERTTLWGGERIVSTEQTRHA